jgi:hypothetical protein
LIPIIPSSEKDKPNLLRSPWYEEGRPQLSCQAVDGIAAGIALVFLMYALDWIHLGAMPWNQILIDASPKRQGS